MRLTNRFFIASFSSLILSSNIAFAGSSIDLRTEYESWNTGINGKTTATLYGLGGTHRLNTSFTVAAGFVFGTHKASANDSAITDLNGTTTLNTEKNNLKRSDFDLALGYHLYPNVTIFGGYRFIKIDYGNVNFDSRSFSDTTHGLGIGVSVFKNIITNTLIYGRTGISTLLSTVKSDLTGTNEGVGFSTGIELGLIYQLMTKTNLGLSLKQQSSTIDYNNDSPKWQNNYTRIGLSLSRYF